MGQKFWKMFGKSGVIVVVSLILGLLIYSNLVVAYQKGDILGLIEVGIGAILALIIIILTKGI